MPYIHLTTSKRLTTEDRLALRNCALNAAALLNKNRRNVMVQIQDGANLSKGDEAGDCAFCDVRVMGSAAPEALDRFSAALSADVARIAQTAPGCVYLSISEFACCYTDGCLPPGH